MGTMSVSVTLQAGKVVVDGSPFDLDVPRAKVSFNIDPGLGTFAMDAIQHKYFGVGETYASFNSDVMLTPPDGRPTHYGLAIMNSHYASARFDGREWIDVRQGEYYFTYNPNVEEVHRFKANLAMQMHFLDIQCDYLTELLRNYSPERDTPLWDVKDDVSQNKFAGVGGFVSMPAFYQVLHGMFNCPLAGPLGQLMLEGSLQQLMALQFAIMGSKPPVGLMNRRDREILHAVKEYLHCTFQQEHSLLELSRRFGINQNKLKTGFRELFGTPVIAYLYELKMEHARKLLFDQHMTVSEVAPVVGYRNANHFSTAFKRRFGINPSRIRRD